jgi:hypothetical protein
MSITPAFDVVPVKRVLSPEQATAMTGESVPASEPNVTRAMVAADADTGSPVFAYLPLGDVAPLRRAVLALNYSGRSTVRANGTRNASRVFGWAPRRPVYRREGCGPSGIAGEQPVQHQLICDYSDTLAALLERIDPRLREQSERAVSAVEPEWRLGESKLWTSGVINQTSVLPFHRDAYNFPAWSAMPVLRRGVDGGFLRIPEYGATIACRDGWGVFFAGYDLLHGVTPMRLRRPDGYRYSVVYYALKGMKDCFTAAVEAGYARKRRTEREQEIAKRLAAGDRLIHNLPPSSTRKTRGGRIMGGRGQHDFDRIET